LPAANGFSSSLFFNLIVPEEGEMFPTIQDISNENHEVPEYVTWRVEHGVALVTLNRPERLNAMGNEMGRQFDRIMVQIAQDQRVRAVVLTGAGRGFCAGSDMERLAGFSEKKGSASLPREGEVQGAYRALVGKAPQELLTRYCAPQALPQPVIAAVNGPCAGIGLALAVLCDIRFASEHAIFVAPFAKRGLVAEIGLASSLAALVGAGAAADILLSGRKVGADEARRMGLVDQITEPEHLLEAALAYARDIANNASPRSTRIIKWQLWQARSQSFADALSLSMKETKASLQSEDFVEGLAHFREKRPPRFTGN
jgi:enoyl-CoA hydratase/carnithine racemase